MFFTVSHWDREGWGLVRPKQYKDRIKKWGLKKNIQPNEMIGMIRKQKEREAGEGKQTDFKLWGRPIDQSKIERYKRDHGIDEDVVMGEDAARVFQYPFTK
jgi:hypothetical protein